MLDGRKTLGKLIVLNMPGRTDDTPKYRITGYSSEFNEIRVVSTVTKKHSSLPFPAFERSLLRADILLTDDKGASINVDDLTQARD